MTKLLDPLRDLLAVDLHQLLSKVTHRAELFNRILPSVCTDSMRNVLEQNAEGTRLQIERIERAIAALGDRADPLASPLTPDSAHEMETLVHAEEACPGRDISLAHLLQRISQDTISAYETVRLLAQRLTLANVEDMATTAIDEETAFIERLNHIASLTELPAQGAN